jgi:uncharacterized protein with von Willebrand factor type A (vWA) domain
MTGKLPENVAYFARALRGAGLRVGPGAVVEAVEALADGALGQRDDVYWALHAIFVKRHEDSAVYDQAFRLFWRRRGLIEKLMAQMSPVTPRVDGEPQKPEAGALRVAEAFTPPPREEEPPVELTELSARLTVSERETLKSRDFAQMSAAEIARARQLIAELRLPNDAVPTRRFQPAHVGARIDPRRTFRRSLRGGGASIDLAFRERAEVHPPVVALVDISGSMAEYSRIFLHFLHARHRAAPARAFLRLRHAADQCDAHAPRPRPGRGAGARRQGGAGLGGRHAHRPRRCTPSTGSGRAGCSRAGRWCCSSPTGWSAISARIFPSRWTACIAPAGS